MRERLADARFLLATGYADLPAAMVGCFAYDSTALVEKFLPGADVAGFTERQAGQALGQGPGQGQVGHVDHGLLVAQVVPDEDSVPARLLRLASEVIEDRHEEALGLAAGGTRARARLSGRCRRHR